MVDNLESLKYAADVLKINLPSNIFEFHRTNDFKEQSDNPTDIVNTMSMEKLTERYRASQNFDCIVGLDSEWYHAYMHI